MKNSILEKIELDGILYWRCFDCGILLRSRVEDNAIQCLSPHESSLAGTVVVLPSCVECASQAFLKADYTMKDILEGDILRGWYKPVSQLTRIIGRKRPFLGYTMKLSHARNFRLLNHLYAIGKFPAPPILPVLPSSLLENSPLSTLPLDIVDSFWLAYLATDGALAMQGIDTLLHEAARKYGVTPRGKLQADHRTVVYDEEPTKYRLKGGLPEPQAREGGTYTVKVPDISPPLVPFPLPKGVKMPFGRGKEG